jgi:hypothetical protein
LAILDRGDKRLNHFSIYEVAVELVQLGQPEVVTSVIRVRRIVWEQKMGLPPDA